MYLKVLLKNDTTEIFEIFDSWDVDKIRESLNKTYGASNWYNFYTADDKTDAENYNFKERNGKYNVKENIIDPIAYCERYYPEMCAEFTRQQEEQYALLCKKQMDYGPLNISMGTQLQNDKEIKAALTGIVVRANDKMQRLVNLLIVNGQEPKNETIEDTFMDLAVYATIAMTVKNGKWGK